MNFYYERLLILYNQLINSLLLAQHNQGTVNNDIKIITKLQVI